MRTARRVLLLMMAVCLNANAAPGSGEDVWVLKLGDTLYARSRFSDDSDVVISLRRGGNSQIDFYQTGLVPGESAMDVASFSKANIFHLCIDDGTPWKVNNSYIGANHGWFGGAFELIVPAHGLGTSDIGSVWRDECGTSFYILKIADSNTVWVMSDNRGTLEEWKFTLELKGSLRNGTKRFLQPQRAARIQLLPSCRITKQEYLVDGEVALQDGVVTRCRFLEITDQYDIINPASVIDAVKGRPGEQIDLVGSNLDALITNRIVYRLQPWGACTVRHQSIVHRNVHLNYMGFVQTRMLLRSAQDSLRYYIPESLPFTAGDVSYDFQAIQDFPKPQPIPLEFQKSAKNIGTTLPHRFIQFLSKKTGNTKNCEIGYVIGYSLTMGCTVPAIRAANSERAAFIHTSAKTYPSAIDEKMGWIPAGSRFEALAYRQYFFPQQLSTNATDAYFHQEGNDYVLYADYHKAVAEEDLQLPEFLSGRNVSVIESTPGIRLLSGRMSSGPVVRLSVSGAGGHVVLRLSESPE